MEYLSLFVKSIFVDNMILSIYGVRNKDLLNYNSAIKSWEFPKRWIC